MEQTKGKEIRNINVIDDHDDDEKWVYDSSVDHKGRLPLRASTGSWKASLFIIGKVAMGTFSSMHFLLSPFFFLCFM